MLMNLAETDELADGAMAFYPTLSNLLVLQILFICGKNNISKRSYQRSYLRKTRLFPFVYSNSQQMVLLGNISAAWLFVHKPLEKSKS